MIAGTALYNGNFFRYEEVTEKVQYAATMCHPKCVPGHIKQREKITEEWLNRGVKCKAWKDCFMSF